MTGYIRTRYLVIGLGLSGQSACAFLQRRGHAVYAYDDGISAELTNKLRVKGVQLVDRFPDGIAQVIVSPGIPPRHPIYQTARSQGVPVMGEAELGLRALRSQVIGITGTNGKTTTTLLVEHVLKKAGYTARAIGNIGFPTTAVCDTMGDDEIAVVELSSFQLETMKTVCFDVAAILNISPDHLDRYADFLSYRESKERIIDCLKPGETVIRGGSIEFLSDLSYREFLDRERENVMVACAICQRFNVAHETFFRYASTFCPPPHRLEHVGTCAGVSFVNDSKATNDSSVRHAVKGTKGPITLIAGGRPKSNSTSNDYESWLDWLDRNKVEVVVAIGEGAQRIQQALGGALSVVLSDSLSAAVHQAWSVTPSGGTVLFSPGGSSFDAYPNYKARGEHFRSIVERIINNYKSNNNRS